MILMKLRRTSSRTVSRIGFLMWKSIKEVSPAKEKRKSKMKGPISLDFYIPL